MRATSRRVRRRRVGASSSRWCRERSRPPRRLAAGAPRARARPHRRGSRRDALRPSRCGAARSPLGSGGAPPSAGTGSRQASARRTASSTRRCACACDAPSTGAARSAASSVDPPGPCRVSPRVPSSHQSLSRRAASARAVSWTAVRVLISDWQSPAMVSHSSRGLPACPSSGRRHTCAEHDGIRERVGTAPADRHHPLPLSPILLGEAHSNKCSNEPITLGHTGDPCCRADMTPGPAWPSVCTRGVTTRQGARAGCPMRPMLATVADSRPNRRRVGARGQVGRHAGARRRARRAASPCGRAPSATSRRPSRSSTASAETYDDMLLDGEVVALDAGRPASTPSPSGCTSPSADAPSVSSPPGPSP